MILKNITSEIQKVKFISPDLQGTQSINIKPYGITRLEKVMLVEQETLKGVIEIIDGVVAKITPQVDTPVISEEDKLEEEFTPGQGEETSEESKEVVEETILEDKFICEDCGQEFASSRSLSSHKTRVHSNQ